MITNQTSVSKLQWYFESKSDQWKDPVKVELPETTVTESAIPAAVSQTELRRSDTVESSDAEEASGYETPYETANENTESEATLCYETATETGETTDAGDSFFSANEDDSPSKSESEF